jgi:hypothetical protein
VVDGVDALHRSPDRLAVVDVGHNVLNIEPIERLKRRVAAHRYANLITADEQRPHQMVSDNASGPGY